MSFSAAYIAEAAAVLQAVDAGEVERVAKGLAQARYRGGRLFVLGAGGSAAHASHAVCDFRRLAGFEAYCPSDNVAELTARVNDEGWDTVFTGWLEASRFGASDGLLVLSVGGGDAARGVSVPLVRALQLAQDTGAAVFGIVGRDGGMTAQMADACVVIPPVYPEHVTVHTEGLCAVIWHLLVSHPLLASGTPRWESLR